MISFCYVILTYIITSQGVRDLGVRKILVVGLPPMGCLPIVITFHQLKNWGGLEIPIPERGCIDSLNSIARDYNQKLQDELMAMQQSFGLRLAYCDIYHPVHDMVQHPAKYGKSNMEF